MLKLVRNCLADEKVLHDGDNQSIEWKFIDHLEKYRVHRNFVPHNLTKKHIQWSRNKMSVRLAAQTFSRSVSNALTYLSNNNCYLFENSEGTAKLSSMINDLFDVFNSKGYDAKRAPFKNAINRTSAQSVFEFLDNAAEYLKSLTIKGENILQSDRRTGFNSWRQVVLKH